MQKTLLTILAAMAFMFVGNTSGVAQTMDAKSQATFDTVMSFMGAMGKGDMETMNRLMADNMVWHNEGDDEMPWIGPWRGKKAIFGFLGKFMKNVEATHWTNVWLQHFS